MVEIFINVKTTGLDPTACSMWGLAGIVRCNGKEETFNYVMKPYKRSIDEDSLRMNGKTLQEIMNYPSQRDAFASFIRLLNRYVNIEDFNTKAQLYGYNSNFNAMFLRSWFEFNNFPKFGYYFWNPYGDIMSYAGIVLRNSRADLSDFRLPSVYCYVTGKVLDTSSVLNELHCVIELFDSLLEYGIIREEPHPKRRSVASGSSELYW